VSDLAPLLARLDGTGVVLTTAFEGRLAGCFATYVGAASMDPPRLIACTSHENLTHELVDRSGVLAVHVLGRAHAGLVERFGLQSGRFADKFDGLAYRLGETGAPILADCLGWIEGSVLASFETGDHTARLVHPVAGSLADHASTPLTSFEVLGRGLDRRSPPAGRWTGYEPDSL
jgi:flavin reductase (DIM6/NTAB) family NADH-FMN oxidoreductase RutF